MHSLVWLNGMYQYKDGVFFYRTAKEQGIIKLVELLYVWKRLVKGNVGGPVYGQPGCTTFTVVRQQNNGFLEAGALQLLSRYQEQTSTWFGSSLSIRGDNCNEKGDHQRERC